MVHELTVPPGTWKQKALASFQMLQLAAICSVADTVLVPVHAWLRVIRRIAPQCRTAWLPVGSAIPRRVLPYAEARRLLDLAPTTKVLGVFGFAYHAGLGDLVCAAEQAVRDAGYRALVLHVGRPSQDLADRLGRALRSDGFLAAPDVSVRLAGADVQLTPYPDGVSGRRTALMAALTHGCAIAGTSGPATDPVLTDHHDRAFLLSDVGDASEWQNNVVRLVEDAGRAEQLRSGAQALYENEFTWDRAAVRLVAGLGYA